MERMALGQTKVNKKAKAYGFTRMGRPEMELDENLALIYDDCKHGRMSVAEAARANKIPRSTLRYRLKIYEEREVIDFEDASNEINKGAERIVIYGAQAVAFSTYKALSSLGYEVLFFVVSEKEGNPACLENTDVISLSEFLSWCIENNENPIVYIATPEAVQQEIADTLSAHDYKNFVFVDSQLFGEIMRDYYSSKNIFAGTDTEKFISDHVSIYQARSIKDKPLKKTYRLAPWVHTVGGAIRNYAGFTSEHTNSDKVEVKSAARTASDNESLSTSANAVLDGAARHPSLPITEYKDNTGKNISEKNCNYSELTVLYFAWKNSKASVIGLEHYRRFLSVTEADLMMLLDGKIDAILPYPMIYTPDISAQRKRWIKDDDWEAVRKALKELAPNYFKQLKKIDAQEYYLNYNILVARREILDEYCSFLFPVLERVEELTGGEKREDRYIKYIGEYLFTLYFLLAEMMGTWKISHAAVASRV